MAGKTVLFLYSRKKSKEDFFQPTHPYYCTFLYEMLFSLCQGGLTAVTNNPKFQLHKVIKIYFLITKIWCRCSLLDSSPGWLHDSAIKDSSCLWRCQFQNTTSKVTREGGKIMGKTYQIQNQLHTQVSSKMSTYILLVRSSHTPPSPTDRCKGMGIYSVWLGSQFPAPPLHWGSLWWSANLSHQFKIHFPGLHCGDRVTMSWSSGKVNRYFFIIWGTWIW